MHMLAMPEAEVIKCRTTFQQTRRGAKCFDGNPLYTRKKAAAAMGDVYRAALARFATSKDDDDLELLQVRGGHLYYYMCIQYVYTSFTIHSSSLQVRGGERR
jgi:hypothetical protein